MLRVAIMFAPAASGVQLWNKQGIALLRYSK